MNLVINYRNHEKIIIFSLIILCGSCGTIRILYDPLEFEEIINYEASKNDLYVIASSWMVETFNNAKSVIQFSDKEEGIIKGKYLMHTRDFVNIYRQVLRTEDIYAIITIAVRDNATKITIDPFGEGSASKIYGTTDKDPYAYKLSDAENEAKDLIANYKKYIQNYKDEW